MGRLLSLFRGLLLLLSSTVCLDLFFLCFSLKCQLHLSKNCIHNILPPPSLPILLQSLQTQTLLPRWTANKKKVYLTPIKQIKKYTWFTSTLTFFFFFFSFGFFFANRYLHS